MAFDYKKEYKEFYLPKKKSEMIEIPAMNFIAIRGKGNPNMEDGEYQQAVGLLYGIAYTIKMSGKSGYRINDFLEYVVPPLEGFWWIDGLTYMDYNRKNDFHWISVIRLPDFVQEKDLVWAKAEAEKKKKKDFSKVEFFTYHEGLCVQCMHTGSYDDEPATIQAMEEYAEKNGYLIDITDNRYHHEIYITDPRKSAPEKLKTVVRHPVRKKDL
ncbi:MAG: GyrI-like domain-containing protein [Bacteroidales bacterium]|jgi:hypothetical protein|nr:GyrI-like domain-containing protein [Bacteroidales bacterium]